MSEAKAAPVIKEEPRMSTKKSRQGMHWGFWDMTRHTHCGLHG